MKDKNGKKLTHRHYEILMEFGIEIVMYNLKHYDEDDNSEDPYGFEVWGSFKDNVDFDVLLESMLLFKKALRTDSLAVKDAFEQLKMIMEMSDNDS